MPNNTPNNIPIHIKLVFFSLFVLIVFSLIAGGIHFTSLLDKRIPSEFFVGKTDNPDYVSHGEVVPTDFYQCYNGKMKTGKISYFYKDGTLYSSDIPSDTVSDTMAKITVVSSVNQDNKDEIITSITVDDYYFKTKDEIKAPVTLGCESDVKDVALIQTKNLPDIKIVEKGGFCKHGTLDFDMNNLFYISDVNYIEPVISLDHSKKHFVIDFFSGYFFDYRQGKEHYIPDTALITVGCDYTPIRKPLAKP